MRADILVASAHLPELSGLGTILGADGRGTSAGWSVAARPVGIGLVAAAVGVTKALIELEPSVVIFVGTCGAYAGRDVGFGDVVVGRRLWLESTAVAEDRAGFPGPMRVEAEASGSLVGALALAGARAVTVATTLAITTDDALAARASAHRSCDVEHLEAFAVAEASLARAVPFAVVLGVANVVGSNARDEWQRNHLAAGHAAGALVARWIEAGAPGIVRGAGGRRP